ncbi:dihydrodipicolinate reductase C-terminal domain-containing protein [Candidatus Vidania fulgoroideorum]
MIKILLSGYSGKIGKKIKNFFKKSKKFKIIYFLNKKNKYKAKYFIKKIDIVIDFSYYKNSIKLVKLCYKYRKKIILGTTGFNKNEKKIIFKCSKKISIFFEPNMNLNFKKFMKIIFFSNRILKKMDKHIIEIHKKKKKDFPSGSCKKILKIIKTNNFSSIRIGNIVGEHKILFCDKYNKIEIKHTSLNRKSFILNLKKIINFINKKKTGFYNFDNYDK